MLFYVGRHLAHVGEPDQGLPFIRQAFECGYFCYPVLASDRWLDPLRSDSAFQELLTTACRRGQHAFAMFVAAGVPSLLGMDQCKNGSDGRRRINACPQIHRAQLLAAAGFQIQEQLGSVRRASTEHMVDDESTARRLVAEHLDFRAEVGLRHLAQ
jgi:hypothetical protein